jgi:hypothetical protein
LFDDFFEAVPFVLACTATDSANLPLPDKTGNYRIYPDFHHNMISETVQAFSSFFLNSAEIKSAFRQKSPVGITAPTNSDLARFAPSPSLPKLSSLSPVLWQTSFGKDLGACGGG